MPQLMQSNQQTVDPKILILLQLLGSGGLFNQGNAQNQQTASPANNQQVPSNGGAQPMDLSPMQRGVAAGLEKAAKKLEADGQKHAYDARLQGVPEEHIRQESGLNAAMQQAQQPQSTAPAQPVDPMQQQAQQLVQPKGFMGRWQDNFNKQVGNVTTADLLDNLIKAQKLANGGGSGFDTAASVDKLSKFNQSLRDAGLPEYQGTYTAEGILIPHPKPVAENDMVMSIKEQQQQDRLEKVYGDRLSKITSNRSGGLGLQDAKVNQAIHLRSLINQAFDPNSEQFNIPAVQYEEISIGLANLLSSTNVTTESMRNGIRQRTAEGDFNGALTYMLGIPKNSSSQAIYKNLISSIDRQGQVSEKLRNKYLQDFRKIAPSRLDKERRDTLESTTLGSSYEEFLKQSPDQSNSNSSSKNTGFKVIGVREK